MDNYVQTVYQRLLNEINAIPDLKTINVKNPLLVSDRVRNCVRELKDHFKQNPFSDKKNEILFFKYQKPFIVAEQIYVQQLYAIESNKPVGDHQLINSYYTLELSFIRRVFDQNRYLYQYFQLDGSEFDELYFSRGGGQVDIMLPVAPDIDPEFSTSCDFLFATFVAFERLQSLLINLLYSPEPKVTHHPSYGFVWTGDKINLIELAYGLYDAAQIGDGETSIAEIIAWLEQSFNVKLPRYFQMFSEIRSRKAVSKSRFLDHMAKMVNLHIEQGDDFKPQKPRPVSGSKSVIKN